MAAYGALVSLSHILHQILNPPPLNIIIIDRGQIEFLQGKVTFMVKFLETYHSSRHSQEIPHLETKIEESSRCSHEIADLEMRIAGAAYEAEDIIESNVVDQIRATDGESIVFPIMGEGIQTVLEKFLSIEKELFKIKIKEDMPPKSDEIEESEDLIESELVSQIRESDRPKGIKGFFSTVNRKLEQIKNKNEVQKMIKKFHSIKEELQKIKDNKVMEHLRPKNSTTARSLPRNKVTLVGFEEHMTRTMEAIATNESNRQVIPIVGMGGMGKTTLANAVYSDPFVVEHFDFRAWVTISQEYTFRELLLCLLPENRESGLTQQESTDELGLQLHKELFGRRYLIVMDDMWNIDAWYGLEKFLPCNNNGSRILVTTRLSALVDYFGTCSPQQIGPLDEEKSWQLLRAKALGSDYCVPALEDIARDIAKKCGGLPLALVVIGGLLAKSCTYEHWLSVERDVNTAINDGNSEHFMQIFSLSYSHLPIYLKPCFLYLAMFPEDFKIRVTWLIRMWVAEGLIKPTKAKCLEEVAYEYLEDLMSRNLILVHKRGSSGKVKFCKIHDLLRDLCIAEAGKEKFVYRAKLDNPNISPNTETKRRLSIFFPSNLLERTAVEAFQSDKFSRSVLCRCDLLASFVWQNENLCKVDRIITGFMLLKLLHMIDYKIHIDLSNLRNLRYVVANPVSSISRMSLCWNLQTLVVDEIITLPAEIWQMPQLRHLKMYGITLPYPSDDQNVIVLENLQTLKAVRNFKCTDQVLKRIPNLKVLQIAYYFETSAACEHVGIYCLNNLVQLKRLESLGIYGAEKLWMDIAFPISLKKLSLWNCKIPWEDLSVVGKLPNLVVLKLYPLATRGKEWNPTEGEFCRLKLLLISCCELKIWEAENTHFPSLERLVLIDMKLLEEIPISFAEISTLQVIELDGVEDSVRTSAKAISDEQVLLGYEPLQVRKYDRRN